MKKEELKNLQEFIEFFDTTNINKIKLKTESGIELELEKQAKAPEFTPDMCPAPQAPINLVVNEPKQIAQTAVIAHNETINSPMVGTFYVAPTPGAKAFVSVGQIVKKGSVIAIIEAMKIMNEIEAEFDCKIVDRLVDDGQPVEYGMPLFAVEKL